MSHTPVDTQRTLGIDRTACTGKGVCASLVPESVTLDEWGYPIIAAGAVDPQMGEIAIRMCPARALFWQEVRSRAR